VSELLKGAGEEEEEEEEEMEILVCRAGLLLYKPAGACRTNQPHHTTPHHNKPRLLSSIFFPSSIFHTNHFPPFLLALDSGLGKEGSAT